MTLRNTFISLLLLIAISLSAWSILLSNKPSVKITDVTSDKPDAFMENVKVLVLNKLGKPTLKVASPKMIHYAEQDATELLKPHVTIFRDSPQPWHIHSNYARTEHGITEITFWDSVVIHHLADVNNPLTTMNTSVLTVLPNEQIAKTDKPIIMTQPDTTIRGIGMLANWNEGTVKLLSQAREEYVPKS